MIGQYSFLVESALLMHGLPGISNEEMLEAWPEDIENITWMNNGEVVIGSMAEFLEFRKGAADYMRINSGNFQECSDKGSFGAFTASGTMEACRRMGIGIAVTCGMGGFRKDAAEESCADLEAIAEMPVALIATSPKDMFDVRASLEWLYEHDVTVAGVGSKNCTGYLFKSADVALNGGRVESDKIVVKTPMLILQKIPEEKRIGDMTILDRALEKGKKAECEGRYFHPTVNGEIDRLTSGYSAGIQLDSIIKNAQLAKELMR